MKRTSSEPPAQEEVGKESSTVLKEESSTVLGQKKESSTVLGQKKESSTVLSDKTSMALDNALPVGLSDDEYIMGIDEEPVTQVEIEAVHWFKKMTDTEVLDVDWQAFQAWLERDEAHQIVYEELMELWDHPYFELALKERSAEMDRESDNEIFQESSVWQKTGFLARKAAGGKGRTGKKLINLITYGALAASALFAAFTWVTNYAGPTSAHNLFYQTHVGEQRTVTLADGSTVNLNTDTRMHVAFDQEVRKITLTRGDAYFDVVKDGRPFIVAGGTGLVKVLGTAFEVQIDEERMTVSVERGRVAVSPEDDLLQSLEIVPRQQLAVVRHRLGGIRDWTGIIADWRDGWLEFEDAELARVAAELDKYYAGNIVLNEEKLSHLRVSGRFHVQDIRKAIRILAKSMKLATATSDTGNIIFFRPNRFNQPLEMKQSGAY